MPRKKSSRDSAECLVILPRDLPREGPAQLESARSAIGGQCMLADEWKYPKGAEKGNALYSVVFPELGVALTNTPPERLESKFDRKHIVRNFKIQLAKGNMRAPRIPGVLRCKFNEDVETWGRQVVQGSKNGLHGDLVKVCVVDTGVMLEHPDFKPRKLEETNHIKSFTSSPEVDDTIGHGTHCAGTICGPNPPDGTPRRYGIAPGVELFVANVFGDAVETTVDKLIAALNWAKSMKCDIVSMSLQKPASEGDDGEAQKFHDLLDSALDAGTLLIASTGNKSDRVSGSIVPAGFPANVPGVLAVGSVTRCLTMMNNSNSGAAVVAPGEEVWSSFHNETGFRFMSGTSMATAHVAGLAALHAQDSGARGRALLNLLRKAANNGQQNPGVLDAGLLKAP